MGSPKARQHNDFKEVINPAKRVQFCFQRTIAGKKLSVWPCCSASNLEVAKSAMQNLFDSKPAIEWTQEDLDRAQKQLWEDSNGFGSEKHGGVRVKLPDLWDQDDRDYAA